MMPPDPESPFLEFGFYNAMADDADSFAGVIEAELERGSEFLGDVRIHRGKGARTAQFDEVTDFVTETTTVTSAELGTLLNDSDTRVLKAWFRSGKADGSAITIITLLSISEVAKATDRHPVAVWTDGDAFSGPHPDDGSREREVRVGQSSFRRFSDLIGKTDPSYAAMTVERGLLCPTDYLTDSRGEPFGAVYLSERFVGPTGIKALESEYAACYRVGVADGLLVAADAVVSPTRTGLSNENQWLRSVAVLKLITAAGRGRAPK
jgi:hypothetical protein